MAVKKRRTFKAQRLPVAIEHTEFYPYLLKYNEAMKLKVYSKSTLHRRESDVRRFVGWCDERGLNHPNQITKPILERYQRYLYYYRQERNNRPLSPTSQNHYLTSVKMFFKYLTRQNYLLYNPASELEIIRAAPSLPVILSENEIERLINQPDTNTESGIRDRAILELFYSTGLRRSELCNLTLHDLSLSRKTVMVRKGKGNKDRLIPVGQRAINWIGVYLDKVRDGLLTDITNETLFLNDYGDAFRDTKIGDKVKRYMKNAGIDVPGSCHLLRHAMATHMLENGAEMRYIQAMLGHANLSATQMYTHVSIRKLQQVHEATHPSTK
ncbi:MAG: site-specific tyrosine recombinase XerC [Puniceicoccaceae bacterium]|nr:site-specific tyrosine recombinase XerC [Puniceicoccaceae bacterium]